MLGKIRLRVVFQLLLKLWPIIGFQLDQFLHEYSIFVVVIGSILPPCNRGVAAFSNITPYNSPCFQEGNIHLVFNLNYFFFFSVNSARSCVSWMVLSTVCTRNFFQAIFLRVVRVLFTAFDTCMSSSTGFPVVSIFLAFEAPRGSGDVLFNSLKTIADLQLVGSTELIKCQDVSVGLDSFFAFSDGDSFYICNSLFSQGWCYLIFCSQCQLSTPDNSLENVELYISACLGLSTSTSKLPFLVFLTVFGLALVHITFSMRKGENFA